MNMQPEAIILRQFTFTKSGGYTSFPQNHNSSNLERVLILPNLYCITFVKKDEVSSIPLGGLFIKTNLHHTDPLFTSLVKNAGNAVHPSKESISNADTFKPTLIQAWASEDDMDAFAATELTKLGVQGSA